MVEEVLIALIHHPIKRIIDTVVDAVVALIIAVGHIETGDSVPIEEGGTVGSTPQRSHFSADIVDQLLVGVGGIIVRRGDLGCCIQKQLIE